MTEEARTIVGKLRCAETELKEVGAAYFEEDDFGSAADLIESLSAQLDQVTRERNAAVEDIPRECHKCKNFKVLFNGCTPDYDCDRSDVCKDNDNWQWRGAVRTDDVQIVPTPELKLLINKVIENECAMCVKDQREQHRCKLRRALMLIAPPLEVKKDGCNYLEVAAGNDLGEYI